MGVRKVRSGKASGWQRGEGKGKWGEILTICNDKGEASHPAVCCGDVPDGLKVDGIVVEQNTKAGSQTDSKIDESVVHFPKILYCLLPGIIFTTAWRKKKEREEEKE